MAVTDLLPQKASTVHRRPPVPMRSEGRIILNAVDWNAYEKFLEAFDNRRIRLTYDRGTLEIMSISGLHEWWKGRIGFLLRLVGAVFAVPVQGYGSATLRRPSVPKHANAPVFSRLRLGLRLATIAACVAR